MSTEIDPVDYGLLKGSVAALQADLVQIKHDMAILSQKMDMLLEALNTARGGWRVAMALGGAASVVAAGAAWAVNHVRVT